jgi:MGT family glycosyltransferase
MPTRRLPWACPTHCLCTAQTCCDRHPRISSTTTRMRPRGTVAQGASGSLGRPSRETHMRALFTFQPGTGMFRPLVPLARALADAGHEVAFVGAESFRLQVEACGFTLFPAGLDWTANGLTGTFPDAPPPGPALLAWIPTLFRVRTPRAMVPALLDIAATWQPDVFVSDPTEFGGCLAAELLGVPYAVASAIWFRPQASFTEPHNEARREFDLPPDPEVTAPYRSLVLATMPSSWVAADEPVPPTAHFIGPRPFAGLSESLDAPWQHRLELRPVVHATLGTTDVNRTPGLYEAIIDGLRDEPGTLIVAVGDRRDPAEFGPQPPNVIVERYVSHAALLPHCDIVLTHGGYGAIMACLSLGLPMVVLPVSADQPRNARRCADLGVARVIGPEERTPEAIRAATQAVLRDPSYRANAERIRDEITSMPGQELAVDLLERLARDKLPIVAAP